MEKPEAATAAPQVSAEPPPVWMVRIVKRQLRINKQYEMARGLVAAAYNDLIDAIAEVNNQYGTDFSLDELYGTYAGDYAPDAVEREEGDDEE